MNIKEAKEIDLVQYLSKLGYEPANKVGNNYWYHSPFRNERTPSFAINFRTNEWYDWGEGKGGNIVDFGILYHRCTVANFLNKLEGSAIALSKTGRQTQSNAIDAVEKNEIKVMSVRTLFSFPLLHYLEKRKIPKTIADQYCSEIAYKLHDKNYYAIGFPNNSGGYELRNQYIKAAASPKDITFIDRGAKDVAVFEGFFNFLSYQTLYHNEPNINTNFLILNSTSFFEKSLSLMQDHKHTHLYLDNDKTGTKFTEMAIAKDKEKFIDERKLYHNYDDLNDWLMNFGRTEKHRIMHKL